MELPELTPMPESVRYSLPILSVLLPLLMASVAPEETTVPVAVVPSVAPRALL